ncbi:MAG TPA: transglutaminase-like domain-containing protein [Kofleriaceae bacterium]|nr:transglutaminase-like domain-containing protein [Kofleriaceae bacterium]
MSNTPEQVLFKHVVQRPDAEIELDVAALLIGDWDHEIDVAGYLRRLDDFADRAIERLGRREGEPFAVVRAINETLFGELGFRGNDETYYDPRNSFLSDVIDRRIGIPISLSVLYIEVARRIGVQVRGIGFPGHFLLRYDEADQFLIFDAFHLGLSLDYRDLESRLARSSGGKARFSEQVLEPADKRQILARMLANLAANYHRAGDPVRCVEVLERMVILEPDNKRIVRELARVQRRVQDLN